MKYSRFEELPVWQAAIEFAAKVFEFTARPQFKGFYSLKDQLERAAVSISNNIAEGFERGTTNELLHFLYIARGSAGECRSMLCLLEKLPEISNLKFEISDLKPRAESISRQLRAWADSLQNSEIKGQRYLNEKVRRDEKRQKDYEEWKQELQEATIQNIERTRLVHEASKENKGESEDE
jgi:four helix bundle protein